MEDLDVTTPAVLSYPASAKLNLTLRVVGRRADGYHLLDSLVAFTEIGDLVTVRPADRLSLILTGPFAPALRQDDGENLVIKAARLLAASAGIDPLAEITLTKILPVASGIGGGSSDAAAALLALRELWQLSMTDSQLVELGLALGADVPVCVMGRSARLQGIGDIVTAVGALPAIPLVLVNPGVGLSTPLVFRTRTGPFSDPGTIDRPPQNLEQLVAWLRQAGNDLAPAARTLLPVIDTVLAGLDDADGCLLARMSGSGATCFGLFADDHAAAMAAAVLQAAHPDWWVVATRLNGL